MPRQCNKTSDVEYRTPDFIRMAENANWTDVTVDYFFSTVKNKEFSGSYSGGLFATLLFFILMLGLGIFGTCVEITKLGDVQHLDYKRLDEISKKATSD